MIYSFDEIDDMTLLLPITHEARRIAGQFASEQPTTDKAEQVRLNTLAIYVVNAYLQMLGIPTDLDNSDSWHPVMRLAADVADLELLGVGKLECRPLKNPESICVIPQEVWDLRIGYVVVQIDDSLRKASLLGFSSTIVEGALTIDQLQPLDRLIDRLYELKQNQTKVNLSQWLNNIFEIDWQPVENLLNLQGLTPVFSFRNNEFTQQIELEQTEAIGKVRRAKLIDLGLQLDSQKMVLVVELTTESAQKTEIVVQVHPNGELIYLPPKLELIVLDESGVVFMQAQARNADNYIQLQFNGKPGEYFSVKVATARASVTEDFAI